MSGPAYQGKSIAGERETEKKKAFNILLPVGMQRDKRFVRFPLSCTFPNR